MLKLDNIPIHILLVEDEKINQRIVDTLLKKKGWHVTIASNGEEALKLLAAQMFNLILVDIYMPEVDGFEVAATVKKLEKYQEHPAAVVAMSASEVDEKKCIKAGIDAFIAKPIDPDQLYRIVEKTLAENDFFQRKVDTEAAINNLGGDEALLRELIQDFIDEEYGGKLLKEIEESVKLRDYYNLYKRAHKLKGSSGCLGINTIYDIAYELEKCGRKSQQHGLEDLFERLQKEYKIIRDHLKQYF
ncbi:multi-sensor hybrid histidine kinase [Clostridium aceticum]|uniref:Stage 0 sporulation protein A homolog n=1 Tax=Clostridium aceticum TaxID=84022 RepID=A0A0D8IDA2_9CLOT|nr:response regulator [Clostridium aceticum]AKL94521.1 multi-sensor hybrid histidine kinase [Clostridium aceticum]KJF28273.1 hypothetical protein TZ02_02520 [Clostridium aceticum]